MSDPGPLAGLQVLDLTRAFGGPLCTMMLGEMGADVIKVEAPNQPDEARTWPPLLNGRYSGYFAALNRNKRAITLNLKTDAGHDILMRLAEKADVFVENFTPGVADRLGIGYDDVRTGNPTTIYCSISGFGQNGPYRTRKGYDPILQAMGGFMGVTGEKGGSPIKSMIPVADISAGLLSTIAILAGLMHRQRTGEGQFIDMSMLDGMVSLLTTVGTTYLNTGVVPPRSGTENPARVPSSAFECADGVYIQLVPNQRQWKRFCGCIGAPELAEDPRFTDNIARIENQDALYPRLRTIFETRPSNEWLNVLLENGIPCGPIYTLDKLFEDPQVIARSMTAELQHEAAGEFTAIRLPFRMSRSPIEIRSAAPMHGEHTDTVLAEMLGLDDQTIAELRKEGAV